MRGQQPMERVNGTDDPDLITALQTTSVWLLFQEILEGS